VSTVCAAKESLRADTPTTAFVGPTSASETEMLRQTILSVGATRREWHSTIPKIAESFI
jgi:hypothetical protein